MAQRTCLCTVNRIAEAGSIEAVLERFIDNPIMSYQTR